MMNTLTMQEPSLKPMLKPLYIRMHANDNVAIVVNDGGLPAGTGTSSPSPYELPMATRPSGPLTTSTSPVGIGY